MFLTQIYGTILGGFVNYATMIAIVSGNKEMLANTDGSNAWSGANIQSYNTNASSWALAHYLYKSGGKYSLVPIGLLVGALLVIAHRVFVRVCLFFSPSSLTFLCFILFFCLERFMSTNRFQQFFPKIGKFDTTDINMPQFIQFAGYIPYNQSQTCILLSSVASGFFVQYYLRNYKPRLFRDYSYMITGAFDGAALLALFILSFAVFGAGGRAKPFPKWWGNNVDGNLDLCPSPGV